ncbi:MAG: hypothetical protein ACI8Y4_002000 [Candidatus Poriferisodalaceae bacterium]|jgi:hypothetical protein
MKISVALTIVIATLTGALAAGAVFFSPTAPGLPGQVTVVTADHEGDTIEGVKVNISDQNGQPVGTFVKSDSDGNAELTLAGTGQYALHVDDIPFDHAERTDEDVATLGLCATFSLLRCVTVEVTGGVVTFPGTATQITSTFITFEDLSPEPRVKVEVRDNATDKFVAGGTISVVPVGPSKQQPLAADNDTGVTVTDKIEGGQYDVTFTPASGFKVIGHAPGPVTIHRIVYRLEPIPFRVVPASQAAEPMVSLTDEDKTVIGDTELDTDEVPTVEEPVANETAPAEEAPAEEAPGDSEEDELRSDCFMYLEMYPELIELDPYLSTYCDSNPADARSIISGLLSELGL